MSYYRHVLQDLDQVLQAKLGGSTGAVGQLGQAQLTALHGLSSSEASKPIITRPAVTQR